MQKTSLIILLVLSCTCIEAQTKLDSLYTVWQDKTQADSTRVLAYKTYIKDGYLTKKPDSAFILAEELVTFAKTKQYPKAEALASFLQGLSLAVTGKDEEAIDYYQRSLKNYEEIGEKKGIAGVLFSLGSTHVRQGNSTQGLGYYERSLKIYEEIGDKTRISNCLINIGTTYYYLGNYPRALDYHQRNIKILEEIGNKWGIGASLLGIGNIYSDQQNNTKALDYYQRSLMIFEELKNKNIISKILNNIGIVYFDQDNYQQALDYHERSLEIREEIGNKEEIAMSLMNFGVVYSELRNFSKAKDYYERSLKIQEEIGDRWLVANILYNIGIDYYKQKMYSRAITVCDKALTLSIEVENLHKQENACNCLYKAYKDSGNTAKALEYHEQFTVLNDSIFNEEKTRKLTELAMQHEFDKQEAATEMEQEKKDVIATQELKQKNFERNGFMAGFVVVLLFAGVVFRQRNRIGKEKERSEKLLLNILPKEVAEELKNTGKASSKKYENVSILFTDFIGFTKLVASIPATTLIEELNHIFGRFDDIMDEFEIEKIETIGDAYMAACGLPEENLNHAQRCVQAAQKMVEFLNERNLTNEIQWNMRVGIHSGPVVAGVVGKKKFAYDLFGDSVNTAARMESNGEPEKINISQSTYELLKDEPSLFFKSRGKILAKGKGEMAMYFVETKMK